MTPKNFGLLAVAMVLAMANPLAASESSVPPPKPWTVDGLNAMDLEDLGDIDWTTVESGERGNAETVVFEGDNTVSIWNAGPAKLVLDEPLPYDEFVVVLKGKLVLTDKDGNAMSYGPGDMFMLPKGFEGTWDMTQEYRELIVVDTQAYNED